MLYFLKRASRFEARQPAAKMLRRSLSVFALVAAALTPSTGYSQVIECRSEKGGGYPWAWREIDGKRCWYKGKAGMDKKLLRWAASTKGALTPKRPPSLIDQYGEREQLLLTYWPPLPSGTTETVRGKRL
jgi:hypothetical protein